MSLASAAEQLETRLYESLDEQRIPFQRFCHAPHFTLANTLSNPEEIEGLSIRNLFLRDRKRRYFLLSVAADSVVDLKMLGEVLGGRLSFASPQALSDILRLSPGAVTPFALLFARKHEQSLRFLLDIKIAESRCFNAHPMRNDRSIALATPDFKRFLRPLSFEAELVDFARTQLCGVWETRRVAV